MVPFCVGLCCLVSYAPLNTAVRRRYLKHLISLRTTLECWWRHYICTKRDFHPFLSAFAAGFEIQMNNFTVTCPHFSLQTIFTLFLRAITSFRYYLGNLFKSVNLPLNIKHCSGYVTVSFSVLFQINYASVWYLRFRAWNKLSFDKFCLHRRRQRWGFSKSRTNCPRAKGPRAKIHRCSPGTSKFIQIHSYEARLRMLIGCWNPISLCWFPYKSSKLSVQKEKRNMQVKCHRTISALMWTKRLKAFHPRGKMLFPMHLFIHWLLWLFQVSLQGCLHFQHLSTLTHFPWWGLTALVSM